MSFTRAARRFPIDAKCSVVSPRPSVRTIRNFHREDQIVSFENVVNFAVLAMSDDTLRTEVTNAIADKDDDEAALAVANIATKRGYACTPDEVKEGYAFAVKMSKGEAELSDHQLDFVSGGRGSPTGKRGAGPNPPPAQMVLGILSAGAAARGATGGRSSRRGK